MIKNLNGICEDQEEEN